MMPGRQKKPIALVTIRPTVVFGENNRGKMSIIYSGQIASGRFLMIGGGKTKNQWLMLKTLPHS